MKSLMMDPMHMLDLQNGDLNSIVNTPVVASKPACDEIHSAEGIP